MKGRAFFSLPFFTPSSLVITMIDGEGLRTYTSTNPNGKCRIAGEGGRGMIACSSGAFRPTSGDGGGGRGQAPRPYSDLLLRGKKTFGRLDIISSPRPPVLFFGYDGGGGGGGGVAAGLKGAVTEGENISERGGGGAAAHEKKPISSSSHRKSSCSDNVIRLKPCKCNV